jgi:hypothetical protein
MAQIYKSAMLCNIASQDVTMNETCWTCRHITENPSICSCRKSGSCITHVGQHILKIHPQHRELYKDSYRKWPVQMDSPINSYRVPKGKPSYCSSQEGDHTISLPLTQLKTAGNTHQSEGTQSNQITQDLTTHPPEKDLRSGQGQS